MPSWEKTCFPVDVKISSEENDCSSYEETTTEEEDVWDNMFHHQSSPQCHAR